MKTKILTLLVVATSLAISAPVYAPGQYPPLSGHDREYIIALLENRNTAIVAFAEMYGYELRPFDLGMMHANREAIRLLEEYELGWKPIWDPNNPASKPFNPVVPQDNPLMRGAAQP